MAARSDTGDRPQQRNAFLAFCNLRHMPLMPQDLGMHEQQLISKLEDDRLGVLEQFGLFSTHTIRGKLQRVIDAFG
ncbi:MAG: hypothetical protein HKN27_15710 [Silicimonas sp.]|nr:hypothetical protein [Silicimonas sp.]